MSEIIQFKGPQFRVPRPSRPAAEGGATILFFTGVRYFRFEDEIDMSTNTGKTPLKPRRAARKGPRGAPKAASLGVPRL